MAGDDEQPQFDLGAAVRKVVARVKVVPTSAPSPITKSHRRIVEAAMVVREEPATSAETAYLARSLVQATLPHSNPGNLPGWSRQNGNLTLSITPGYDPKNRKSIGFPYGSIPRLLLFWMTREAIQNKALYRASKIAEPRRLDLGNSLASFMTSLGMDPSTGGGKRGDAARLREQMNRLLNATISIERVTKEADGERQDRLNAVVARQVSYWWDKSAPDQISLFGSYVQLSEDFFEALTAAPVPVDMRALRALKQSPLALDLYALLTYEAYRTHMSGKDRFIAWSLLMEQMGTEYADQANFRKKAKAALRKIQVLYPRLHLGTRPGGLHILPSSFPAIQPKPVALAATKPA
jgi:hypothetical protein